MTNDAANFICIAAPVADRDQDRDQDRDDDDDDDGLDHRRDGR